MTTNVERFKEELTRQYATLFAEAIDYRYVAKAMTPEQLAAKMTSGLFSGTASKDGRGIQLTCKALGIAHTYKAILTYLATDHAPSRTPAESKLYSWVFESGSIPREKIVSAGMADALQGLLSRDDVYLTQDARVHIRSAA